MQVEQFTNDNKDSLLSKLILASTDLNLPYVRYYVDLENDFSTPLECFSQSVQLFKTSTEIKIKESVVDPDSKLATYLKINPDLICPILKQQQLLGRERILLTRYRTGSHY